MSRLTFLTAEGTSFDGCTEAIRQAPLLEFCSLTLNEGVRPRSIPSRVIPKTTVRLMRLRTLKLSYFPVEFLTRFIDVLELPSLEIYFCQSTQHDRDIGVDSVISLLNRSGSRLKQLELLLDRRPSVEYFERLFYAVPSLQNLKLEFSAFERAFIVDDLLRQLSLLPPGSSEGSISGYLPLLQFLALSAWRISMWMCIPHIFNQLHRKNLGLEVNTFDREMAMDTTTLVKILRLVDRGANIRIVKCQKDYLQQFDWDWYIDLCRYRSWKGNRLKEVRPIKECKVVKPKNVAIVRDVRDSSYASSP